MPFLCRRNHPEMAEPTPKPGSKLIRRIRLVLKVLVSGLCIWYVSGKINFQQAGQALAQTNGGYLGFAFLAFLASKMFASVRLNIYFRDIGVSLSQWQNLKLYWQGMFYNLFLPGSISGDAYKVVLISRQFGKPFKKATAAVLIDRFSGLLGLGMLLAAYSCVLLKDKGLIGLVLFGILAGSLLFYFLIKRYFKHFHANFLLTLFWAILVQASQVVCAYLIMAALGIPTHITEYIFIFLVSSVASVLPLTIGGLGIRELVFLEGSRLFGLVQETSVLISILFYLITVLTSLPGLIYVFRNPLKNRKDPRMSP
jgi:glycosyltransferase 2 family protein